MSLPNMAGSTPAAVPIESGGASASTQLQWVQTQLTVHTEKLSTFERTLGEAVNSIKELTKEEAERATKLAIIEINVSHIRDSVTGLKQSQITEATLRALHTEMLNKQHHQHVELLDRMNAIQNDLTLKVVASKDAAANDLRTHEERARSGRRWIIKLLIGTIISLIGMLISGVIAYFKLKG